MYVFAGPTQPEITAAYQMSAVGLPPMQQYFTFGFHQCRWGYANWTVLQSVVDNYEAFGIPLENIWTDIDYMSQYRDFDNDPVRFNYSEGEAFLSALHASGKHYIPIIDSAIYVPNPSNTSDNYSTFDNGNATGAFITNPDGSLYIGDVWPGYTVRNLGVHVSSFESKIESRDMSWECSLSSRVSKPTIPWSNKQD